MAPSRPAPTICDCGSVQAAANWFIPWEARLGATNSTDTVGKLVHDEMVDLLYRKSTIALLTVVVNSILLAALLHDAFPASWTAGWVGGLVSLTLGRALLAAAYRRRGNGPVSTRTWESLFTLGSLLNGIVWGLGAAAFVETELPYVVAVCFVVGGMVAGASSSASTSLRAYYAFAVPAVLPAVVRLSLSDEPARWLLAATGLLFGVAMSVLAHQTGRVLAESARLRFLNATLARELGRRSRERSGRLQILLDHAGVVTVVADPRSSDIIDVSENAMSLTGRPLREILGRRLIDTFELESAPQAADWGRLVRSAGREPVSQFDTLMTPSGPKDIEITATVQAVHDVDYMLIVIKDVTERRAMERQLARASLLASVGTLSAGVAHEVNNPLAYVIGNLHYLRDQLRKQPDLQDLDEPLADALEGADRIRQVVADLMATARPPTEGVASVDPEPIVKTCLRITDNQLRHRARVVFDAQETPPVRADALRLNQVLLNLLLNASEALPEGDAAHHRVTIRLRYEPIHRTIRIEVEDTGHGIRDADLPHVFDPFFTTRPAGSGIGLGLSICRSVIEGLGGTIAVRSEFGRGTTFTVRLPEAAPVPKVADAPPPPDATRPTSLELLIVEDDEHFARTARRMLSGHHTTIETSATGALTRLFGPVQYDAIICDLMMPDLTGVEFYQLVLLRRPALARRIVFVTGGAFTPDARSFLETIRNPRLTKPFDGGALQDALTQVTGI
ncbi:MAG: ATP-binding protein [Myxococcota bacterium]